MKKYLLLLAFSAGLISCGHKAKQAGNGNDELADIQDFFDLFKPVSLPINFSDTSLNLRGNLAVRAVSYKSVSHFVPDSILNRHFDKGMKPKIYPLGKVEVKGGETYLFVKLYGGTRRILALYCFDSQRRFAASKSLIITDTDGGGQVNWQATMDNKYTVTTIRQHHAVDGQLLYRREVYSFSPGIGLALILTESNETSSQSLQIINPIDTMARKHKYSGDYVQDKRNFISIRDAKNQSHMVFFVHFEKDNGNCKGELKGEARFVSPSTARFEGSRDPCTIQFSFSDNKIRMKEMEGCGNHRDIKCFFEGDYPRIKEVKSKPIKKRS
jgi:hypothetical protein